MKIKIISKTNEFESKDEQFISMASYKGHPDPIGCAIIERFKKNEKYYPVRILNTKPIKTVIVYDGYDQTWKDHNELLNILNEV